MSVWIECDREAGVEPAMRQSAVVLQATAPPWDLSRLIGTVGFEPTPPASKADALPLRHVPGI